MSDRRKETRRKLMAFTSVYELTPRTLLGYLGDLTLHGALVIGAKPVPIQRETKVEIDFPGDLPDVDTMPVTLPVRVAWCHQDESPTYFNIGLEFTDLHPKHAELFQAVLGRYHFRHVMPETGFKRE